ncbi:MAG TPA: ubiquitin-like domain-containing protein, partial [Dehalococcoidia bacterium]|nr:ubiquitin-like domain-containing protein [Dehalococcoidia bacterium]
GVWLPPLWITPPRAFSEELARLTDLKESSLLMAVAPPERGELPALSARPPGPQKGFFIHEGETMTTVAASDSTVGEALAALKVPIGPADLVMPQPQVPLTAGLHIYIKRARALEVAVDGANRTLYAHRSTLGDALAEAEIALSPLDRLDVDPSTVVYDSMKVAITRVREEWVEEQRTVPATTIYRYDPTLARGESRRIPGHAGVLYQEVATLHEDGELVSRSVTREWWDPEPEDTVILWGTREVPQVEQEGWGGGECVRTVRAFATWYNPASSGKRPTNPGYGITATGVPVRMGIVAVDPRVIPLGTRLYIPGYGPGVAADTGGAIKGYAIDLGYPDGVAVDWSNRWVDVCILG